MSIGVLVSSSHVVVHQVDRLAVLAQAYAHVRRLHVSENTKKYTSEKIEIANGMCSERKRDSPMQESNIVRSLQSVHHLQRYHYRGERGEVGHPPGEPLLEVSETWAEKIHDDVHVAVAFSTGQLKEITPNRNRRKNERRRKRPTTSGE
jgi:hypothetical protein